METKAASFVLCIVLAALCSGKVASRSLIQHQVATYPPPYPFPCGYTLIDYYQEQCERTQCYEACREQYLGKYPWVKSAGGACPPEPNKCGCFVICSDSN
ncbi:hypothetical protein ACP70R_006313 [Stipagrostis hirtigluma subsp. patula]